MFGRRRVRAELRRRVADYVERGDPSVILSDDTDALAAELERLGRRRSGATPLDVASTVSVVRWLRYLALPPAAGERDRIGAMSWFAAIIGIDPDLVPVEARASAAGGWFRPAKLDAAELGGAIAGLRAASSSEDHFRFGNLVDLRNALHARWQATGSSADLDEVIAIQQQILDLTPVDDQRDGRATLAHVLRLRFERQDKIDDLTTAIEQWRIALDGIPADHPDRGGWRSNLGLALNIRAQLTGDRVDQDEAISVLEAALAETSPDDPRRVTLQRRIADARARRDSSTASVRADNGHDQRTDQQREEARRLVEVAWQLAAAALETADVPDIERLVAAGYPTLAPRGAAPAEADRLAVPDDQTWRHAAAAAEAAGRDETAFVLYTVALMTAPPDVDLIPLLSRAITLSTRLYVSLPAIVDWAVYLCDELLARPTAADLRREVQPVLAVGLLARHEEFRVGVDLDRAIGVLTELTGSLPVGDPDRVGHLEALAEALVTRFRETARIADINTAADLYQQVLDSTATASPTRAAASANLGEALRLRYEVTRQETDIETAIGLDRDAIAATPKDSPEYPDVVNNLALAYRSRFVRSGHATDIDTAVELGREALATAAAHDRNKARLQANLAESLATRMGSFAPDDVIAEMAETVRDMTANVTNERERLNAELTAARMFREDLDRSADLNTAIDLYTQAAAAAPTDREHASYLSNLGNLLRGRAIRDGLDEDSAAAVEALAASARILPPGDAHHANILLSLGLALRDRLDQPPWQDQLRQAAGTRTAPSHIRLRAAREWAEAAARSGDFDSAVEAYTIAVEQLLLLTWHGRDRTHQEEQLTARPGLARDAAACAVAASRPGLAVELLEQGRSVLWSRTLDLRTDLTRLAEAAPALYADLDRVRTNLDDPHLTAVDERLHLTQEWERLVDQARRLDGFTDFLRPAPQHKLLAAADGPVAVVNTSQWRCDALIVRPGGVTSIALPDLTAQDTADRANAYLDALRAAERADDAAKAAWARARSTGTMADRQASQRAERALSTYRIAAETTLTETLRWLWDTVAGPVLSALGHDEPPPDGTPWPRVWWCPTGPLALLPIHAAGYHDGSVRSVVDRVVSSYTPTLRALSGARVTPEPGPTGTERMLVVAVADAPGQPPLAGVANELAMLSSVFPGDRGTVLSGPSATRDAVRAELGRHRWVHFSCHGDQTLDDPTRGGLALYDDVLTIADVRGQRYPADFACLSACKTATGGTDLADEAIALASALHYVGCRHVVGTLWSVYDSPATTELFQDLYRGMAGDGSLNPSRSAHALHHAVLDLRNSHRAQPTVWTPFVHIGP